MKNLVEKYTVDEDLFMNGWINMISAETKRCKEFIINVLQEKQ